VIERVAYLSMHTSPLSQPGTGNAGGLNVYVDELGRTMAGRGIKVDLYTRRTSPAQPGRVQVEGGYTVHHIDAGPQQPLPVAALPRWIGIFAEGTINSIRAAGGTAIVHSHYWLSGWAGVLVKEAMQIPLANSFHTLGRIKDLTRRADESPSSPMRTLTEEEVIARSDCVIASTPYELDDLLNHYGANPEQVCVSPPGIDHTVFKPGDRDSTRKWLGLGDYPMILFVGRIQALKGLDIALHALSRMQRPAHLVVVGGPSGADGAEELARLHDMCSQLGLDDRVHFVATQPHVQLAGFYQVADVLIMPSRSESFGLVAAEAQACALPVVASRIGGIPHVVSDERSGILVPVGDAAAFAGALDRLLGNDELRHSMSEAAVVKAADFSWKATADRLLELYQGISGQEAPNVSSAAEGITPR